MRLRRALSENKVQVEAKYDDAWIPLANLGDLSSLADKHKVSLDFSSSILAVLELGSEGWNDLQQELSNTASRSAGAYQNKESQILLPFTPKSSRDFMLFEDHIINSTRGYVERFMPSTYRISSLIESITRKLLRKFHPHSLWYKQPIYYFGNHLNFVAEHNSIC
jgi:hypothetical protein